MLGNSDVNLVRDDEIVTTAVYEKLQCDLAFGMFSFYVQITNVIYSTAMFKMFHA